MATSAKLSRAALNVETARMQLVDALRRMDWAIRYYQANALGSELNAMVAQDVVVNGAQPVTKEILVESAAYGATAIYRLRYGDGANTLLGTAPLSDAAARDAHQKLLL